MTTPYIIAIAGGIGSGKSIVSRIIATIGYPVYDCDSNAKILMDSSSEIKDAIAAHIDSSCVTEGCIDRKALAAIVFADDEKLALLNSIVHGAVREHFKLWTNDVASPICFIETAILYQSGLDGIVDEVWQIDAPTEVRISRVMHRNGFPRETVMSRIQAQDSFIPTSLHPNTHTIINDGDIPLLPQVEHRIDQALCKM